MVNVHPQAYLREWCTPVRWEFGLFVVETSLSSFWVKGIFVFPNIRIKVEGALKLGKKLYLLIRHSIIKLRLALVEFFFDTMLLLSIFNDHAIPGEF